MDNFSIFSGEDNHTQQDPASADVEQSIEELPKSEKTSEIKSADSKKGLEATANISGNHL